MAIEDVARVDERLDCAQSPPLVLVIARTDAVQDVRRDVLAVAYTRQVIDVTRECSAREGGTGPEIGTGSRCVSRS